MSIESFEAEAEKFYQDTGYLAPGKSESPAALGQLDFDRQEVRRLLKDAWDKGRRREALGQEERDRRVRRDIEDQGITLNAIIADLRGQIEYANQRLIDQASIEKAKFDSLLLRAENARSDAWEEVAQFAIQWMNNTGGIDARFIAAVREQGKALSSPPPSRDERKYQPDWECKKHGTFGPSHLQCAKCLMEPPTTGEERK